MKIVYTLPVFWQECKGLYARFHDVIQGGDPPWQSVVIPMRRYYGQPSPQVLFRDGPAGWRLLNFLRHVAQASRTADVVHVVEGQFPWSALIPLVVPAGVPMVAGPNVALGVDRELKEQYWGPFGSRWQRWLFGLTSIYAQNKLVYHHRSPLSRRYKRVFMFKGYAEWAVKKGLARDKVVVMPAGVRSMFRPQGERADLPTSFAILWAGDARRAHIKGFDVLLAGLAHLKDRGLLFRAYVLGTTDAGTWRAIEGHGLAERVEIVGCVPRASMPLWYRGADVYVCSSRYEADSTTAVEALACGCPVVGSDVPGIQKTLAFRVGDGLDLADKLALMYGDRIDYRWQVEGEADRWGIEGVVETWRRVYEEVQP